ncbi:hypothetical protein HMPREF3157_03605 [Dermabacter sp. HMSC06F07]|uniref:Uncharacterized protein n=1 Tax=Dermabacter hominis 1368 TaxID=1450519 RepID=A0ABR4SMS6_9MICO|nr:MULTISPECIES: hypothetical protein [Dermabacter]KDS94510.1 hypothetical protein DHOM_00325 [Dermabacter hominis 1368]MDU0937686.1 hypothetical protein [Dermabacter sp.]MCT1806370.1 hypothetical protein [Dermabacter hominis]MDK8802503.1 hypothetical protein [Dermabacter hominis]OFT47418.1 hypothetical protein HMPREF3157_03605 [Dermabacter sp. HMSC06F07]
MIVDVMAQLAIGQQFADAAAPWRVMSASGSATLPRQPSDRARARMCATEGEENRKDTTESGWITWLSTP